MCVKLVQLRILWSITRIENSRNVKIAYEGTPEGTRSKYRQRLRWMDCIKDRARQIWKKEIEGKNEKHERL